MLGLSDPPDFSADDDEDGGEDAAADEVSDDEPELYDFAAASPLRLPFDERLSVL